MYMPSLRSTAATLTQIEVAIVTVGGEVELVEAATSRDALIGRLAGWVAARAGERLYPADAARVLEAVLRGDAAAAVDAYFGAAARPWDMESLTLRASTAR